MLLTKEVEIQWHGLNREYYENKGYVFTKQRDVFICKIEDLMPSNHAFVEVKCDTCGNIYEFPFKNYTMHRKDNYLTSLYECRECEIKRIWDKVEDTCIELNYKLLSNISVYKTHKSKIEFICNKHKDYGTQSVTVNELLVKKTGCKLCSNEKKSLARKIDFEDVKHLFLEKNLILLSTTCKSAKEKLEYICPIHNHVVQRINYDHLKHEGCKYCGLEISREKLKKDFKVVSFLFENKNLILLDNEDKYENNMTPLRYLCKKHIDKGEQTITYSSLYGSMFGCEYCAGEYRAKLHSKGGITPLHNYLRGKLSQWNKDSMVNCHYKCVLTNQRFDTVHHLYGFNKILLETLEELDLPIYNVVNKYTDKELKSIEDTCLKLHYEHELGVCLNKDIHNLFHSLYSRGNNTPEQFEEFKQRYYNFEFDNLLEDKYKYCNVFKKVI